MSLDESVGGNAGPREVRHDRRTTELAVGTLACPICDAPVAAAAGPMSPADPLSCPVCLHAARVRDFLTLGAPTRPARVVVRVVGGAVQIRHGARDLRR